MSNKARVKSPRRPTRTPRSPFAKSRGRGITATAEPFGFGVQRWTLVVTAALVQVVVLTSSADAVEIPKLTLLLLSALLLLAISAARVAARGALVVPNGVAFYAAVAWGVASLIATAVAPATGLALWGSFARNIGLWLFLACLVLFATAVRVADEPMARRLALALVAVGGLLSFYSLLQRLDVDPIPWQKAYANPASTLGNPDFAGAFYGVVLPLAIWAAVWAGLSRGWRVACAGVVLLLLAGVNISGAAQGYVGAAAGVFMLVLGWLMTQRGAIRRHGLLAWGAAAVVGLGLLAAGLASAGPVARLGGSGAVSIRRHFWETAATMFGHHPVAGVGMNMYSEYFPAYRSQAAVNALGPPLQPEAPHSVPIAMFANGGLLLGLSYLVFVIAIGVALVRALRRDDGPAAMLTAALGAAWVAYQIESTVSIDVVPLATLHFALAGVILARSGVATRTIALGNDARRGRGRPDARPNGLVLTAVTVAGVVLAWFAIQPLRASVHASQSSKATASGDNQRAYDLIKAATEEAPSQSIYWIQRSKADGALGRVPDGLADLRRALDQNPRDWGAAVSLAQVEAQIGDKGAAAHWYRYAIRLDPRNPDLRAALANLDEPQ